MTPSPPRPAWRSHKPARQLVEAQPFDLLGRHEQEVVAVGVRLRNRQHQRHLERVEDPGRPPVNADFRIARGQAQQDAGINADAAHRVARAEPQQAAILGARRDDVREVGAADKLADDLGGGLMARATDRL